MKRFTCETRREDAERTGRLLDAADIAFECEPANATAAAFEAVVMEGLLTDTAVEVYPPAGHTYPKRG
ncbi:MULTISPECIES: hypothetical protein [Streptomyces]|uniref:Uncharacterized protein n=1 Tax=Streptomyces bottropensis ATCC 25435 TaxID=1054862 RepID=M3DKB0_9ACTN|nr:MULTISPECIES: hypothetical protein [Streptomyces]EMF57302.1 hypothetical protein SBD_1464 [Streptomyces bottropensis ATCC 25435]MZD19225.1 hypothetical protein [Streptomyces sp. SID5476]